VSQVVLYTREGCHLCDEAKAGILALCDELPWLELREVDIERDERLHASFFERIPVVEVEGRPVCELGLDREALVRALDEARANRSGPIGRQIP
jgi:hypothetical protein